MKRLLAILLALVMILSMIPMTAIPALAEEYLISDELPVEEPAEAPAEEETPAEEPAEAPAEEAPAEEAPAEEAPVEEPAKKNTEAADYCGYEGVHLSGVINGCDASVAEDGSLIVCSCNFPDANFGSYIGDNVDKDFNGLLDAEELLIGEIDCRELGITSLKGIEFFGGLLELNCSANSLTKLDLSNNTTLVRLYCSINSLTELDLSANTALKTLNCSDNALTELDVSGNSALVTLYCDSNSLTELDLSANTALQELTCSINALTKLVLSVHPELDSIGCARNALTELNLSGCPKLRYLGCDENQLTTLDVSANTELVHLYCSHNNLTALNASKNTNLYAINCFVNQLTELNVSGLTALERLDCSDNALTKLDLTGCTALEDLRCYDNALTALDVSANTALKKLQCAMNPLTTLDVSSNAALIQLSCYANNLIALDVSHNPELFYLNCDFNELTSLDVTSNPKLQVLECSSNALTELDLSNNPLLVQLTCTQNSLTELDLSGCAELQRLLCYYNALTQLDLSADAPIWEMNCQNQYWYGGVDYTMEDGWYVVDMSQFGDISKISAVGQIDGSCAYMIDTGLAYLESDPNQVGVVYEYYTGNGAYSITCNINVSQGGSGDEPGGEPEYIVLDIPPIEEMTQLYLGEEVVVQWTREDSDNDRLYWFYFIPERDMATTFLTTVDTNAEEYVDPWAYRTDAEGNVIVYSDDNYDINSGICADVQEGETYFFAVKNINVNVGPLPVVILEGYHSGGGSGGDEPTGPSFADIAPPIGEMTAMELGAAYEAVIEEGGYAWFAFTPEESGTYSFFSSNNYDCDPFAYLLNADLEVLNENDDAGSLNFSLTEELEAGQTYILAARNLRGDACAYTVQLAAAKTVTAISVEPISIPEGAWCWYEQWEMEDGIVVRPWYSWEEVMEVTLTFTDGITATGVGNVIIHDGVAYNLNVYDSQRYTGEIWTAGETYPVRITAVNDSVVAETTVTITDCPIESITFDAVQVPENAGYLCEEYGEDEDGNEVYYEYFRYDWGTYLKWDVTFSDGTEQSGSGSCLTHNGYEYWLTINDSQGPANTWEVGNTYTGTVYVAGVSQDVEITVVEAAEEPDDEPDDGEDFSNIAPPIEEMTVLELDTDYTANLSWEDNYEWFTFTPEKDGAYTFFSVRGDSPLDPMCYLLGTDMKVITKNDDSDEMLNFAITRNLQAGVTYVFAVTDWKGLNGSYTVRIKEHIAVTGISAEPISMPAYSWCDHYSDGDQRQYEYYWRNKVKFTLTFSDGGTVAVNGNENSYGLYYNDVWYDLDYSDTQQDNPWEEGGTYPVTISCDGYTGETTVILTECPVVSISVEDIVLLKNSNGYEDEYKDENGEWVEYYYYDWFYAAEILVTFADGTTAKVTDNEVCYGDDWFLVGCYDNQWEGEMFLPGQTNTGYVYIGDVETPVNITIHPSKPLDRVDDLKITSISETSVKIRYDKVKNAERYNIYVNGKYWDSTTKTSYTLKDLTCGDYYYIEVAAAKKVDGEYLCGPFSYGVYARPHKDIRDCYIRLAEDSFIYDGSSKRPEVIVKTSSNGEELILGADYDVYYYLDLEIGTGLVEVYGYGEYGESVIKYFDILPGQVTGLEVTASNHNSATITFNPVEGAAEYWVYKNGDRVEKITETTYTFTGLSAGKTYKFSVRANAEGAKPEIVDDEIVYKTANYTGAASEEVSVKPVYHLEDCSAEIKYLSKAYTGKKITNSFTVKNVDGKSLKKDTDYTVSYENNKEMGTATAILEGKGKYAGEIRFTFDIVPAKMSKPKVKVEKLTNGTSLYITFKSVKNADWFNIYLNGELYNSTGELGHFTEWLEPGTYNVSVAAVSYIDGTEYVGAPSDSVKVTVRHSLKNCSASLSKNTFVYTGQSIKPAVTVYGYDGEVLTEGVDYTLSWKNNKKSGVATVEIKGKGNYEDSLKENFLIRPAAVEILRTSDVTSTTVKLSWKKTSSADYYTIYEECFDENGNPSGLKCIKEKTTSNSYTVKGLKTGEEHYYVVYSVKTVKYGGDSKYKLENWGEPVAVWAGKSIGDCKITLEYTKIAWTGGFMEPQVTVKTSSKKDAKTLVQNVDYLATTEFNDAPGKAVMTIVGIGEYAGFVDKTFDIVPGKVENMWAEAQTTKIMYVTWDEVPGATEYWVYVNGSRKKKVSAEETFCTISGLKKGKTYKVTVKAVAKVDGKDYVGEASEVWKCYMIPKDQV